jgi:hypothetical protein
MAGKLLISSAYLPPVEYYSLILNSDEVIVEKEENYIKQTYRNRCYILSSHGPQLLTVPVYLGSVHKTPVKNIRIDYSKRWQQVHLRAIRAAYSAAPYFEFYFEDLETEILKHHEFLLDLNEGLSDLILKIIGVKKPISFSTQFTPVGVTDSDFRYKITPKDESSYRTKEYHHVFKSQEDFVSRLSIIDLLFNLGPEAVGYL